MSRGTPQPQSDSSSDWLQKKLTELRHQLLETESWPETAEELILDLSKLTPSPQLTPTDEEYDMLSIVVNDALIGIDVVKKYPAFYARMLVDEVLQSAFLDTLELLEQSRSGKLPDYSGPDRINLDFLHQVISKPIIRKSPKDMLELIWQRTAEQLQNMFYIASLRPGEVHRSGDSLLGGSYINILHSQVEVDEQEIEIRLDATQTITDPDNLDLLISIAVPEEAPRRFEATIAWGDYLESAEVNKYGLAKFPPLNTGQILTSTGELMHGIELRLQEVIGDW
jgi:hypothetical protein